jgi:hypothetical protein
MICRIRKWISLSSLIWYVVETWLNWLLNVSSVDWCNDLLNECIRSILVRFARNRRQRYFDKLVCASSTSSSSSQLLASSICGRVICNLLSVFKRELYVSSCIQYMAFSFLFLNFDIVWWTDRREECMVSFIVVLQSNHLFLALAYDHVLRFPLEVLVAIILFLSSSSTYRFPRCSVSSRLSVIRLDLSFTWMGWLSIFLAASLKQ